MRRFRRFAHVLFIEGRRLWITLGATAAILLFPGFLTCDGSDRLRYAALLLQLLGIVVVAIGISETRALFARPSLAAITKSWLRDLHHSLTRQIVPVGTAHEINLAGSIRLSSSATGTLTSAPSTIDQRLSALEAEVTAIRQHVNERVERVVTDLGHLRRDLVQEAKERNQSTQELRRLIETEAAGSLHLEIMGLFWLLVGTILGSITELASLVVLLPCRA